jgi:hypothetical protein
MAAAPTPGYVLKGDRAGQHLVFLKDAIQRYADRHPYEVRKRVEGKKKGVVHRFHFTEQPEPMLGLVAADFIYNMRSGLDHLMAALVPSARRDSSMFPVFWQGVWDDPPPRENVERTKARERWQTYVKGAHPDAVAFIKTVQPADDGGNDPKGLSSLVALNRLSNTDRHSKLPILAASLHKPVGSYTTRSSVPSSSPTPSGMTRACKTGQNSSAFPITPWT